MSSEEDSAPLDFETTHPANHRMAAMQFDDAKRVLAIDHDNEEKCAMAADSVVGLYGCRLRRESTIVMPGRTVTNMISSAAAGVATSGMAGRTSSSKTPTKSSEEFQYALAMRVNGQKEVWYLLAASFNFRKALGAEALYSADMNFKAFVRRLAAFCPGAAKDGFFQAILEGNQKPLPPPMDSLLQFLKSVSGQEKPVS